jgi:hypothetical protein
VHPAILVQMVSFSAPRSGSEITLAAIIPGSRSRALAEVEAMPVHDWTRVEAGIFHDFHHEWISTIRHALNDGLLPPEYYALAEAQAAGFGPDILRLQAAQPEDNGDPPLVVPATGSGGLQFASPKTRFTAESSHEVYRRKKSTITVRHVSGDHIVAVVEIISPGNKTGKNAFNAWIDKSCVFVEHKIHLLIVDLFPPTKRDPNGIHAAIWDAIAEEPFALPPEQPLTLAAYVSDLTVRAYVNTVAVGDPLPDMPLYLEPHGYVLVPLEATYQAAWQAVPRRWRAVLEPPKR